MERNLSNLLIINGGSVKATEEGVIEGLGIVFTSENEPDRSSFRDFFTPDSFVRKSKSFVVPVYYNHGMGPINQEIGEATLTKEDTGWRAVAKLYMDDPVAKTVFDSVKSSAHGFSTGAMQHLVSREAKSNDTNWLKKWVVGEISLTETPAEPKAIVENIKSVDGEIIREPAWEEAEKGVSGASGLPLASRDRAWDASAAVKRVRTWAGVTDKPNAKYKKAFFWWDSANADNLTAGKLPFADVINGQLTAIPRGIFAVAQRLSGTNIPAGDKTSIQGKVSSYYGKMRKQFKDDTIVAPWDSKKSMTNEEVTTTVAVYNADGLEIWNLGSDEPIPADAKSIEIKDMRGSVTYSVSSYDPDTSSGTDISVYQWGGIDGFISHLQDVVNAAAAAVQADSTEDSTDPADSIESQMMMGMGKTKEDIETFIRDIVKSELNPTEDGTKVSELENQLKEKGEELADVSNKLSESEDALAKANEKIARLEILAGAKQTIDNSIENLEINKKGNK